MGKLIEGMELRANARQKLQDVIPLEGPLMVYLEPTSLCNFRCSFCPTGDKVLRKMRPNGLMPYDLFCKIVDDMKEMPRLKRINLYKDGESLVHKRFPEMVSYLKRADVSDQLWLRTNGYLLNPDLNQRLVDSGLDLIGISVEHVTAEGYKEIADVDINYDKFLENIADLYSRRNGVTIYIKITDVGLTPDQRQKFHEDFADKCDYIAIEHLHGWSMSEVKDWTLGTNPTTFDGLPLTKKIVCPLPFYMLGINWNGTVSLCNEDWAHKTLVGDLNNQSLKEIWNGDALLQMRRMHLEGRRSENSACKNCYYLQTLPDNVDPYREQILEKLK